MFTKAKKSIQGFTLIELLVVIAIISLLASVVFASLSSARKKSRDARRIADIKQLQLALELYFDANAATYPNASVTCSATVQYGLEDLVTAGFIPQIPRDPFTNTCYKYATASAAPFKTYHIGALLEDSANSALNGDKDCNSDSITAPPCVTGLAYTNGFIAAGVGNLMYDAIP